MRGFAVRRNCGCVRPEVTAGVNEGEAGGGNVVETALADPTTVIPDLIRDPAFLSRPE